MSATEQDPTTDQPTTDPTEDPYARPTDPGAYIGSRPERQAETIPGGITDEDERIAAHSTQTAPVVDESADLADPREAGQNR